jgi:hypothetical protein
MSFRLATGPHGSISQVKCGRLVERRTQANFILKTYWAKARVALGIPRLHPRRWSTLGEREHRRRPTC